MYKILLVVTATFTLMACGSVKTETKVGQANPASVYCQQQGGTSQMRDTAQGQVSDCHLPDGRVIEEWTLLRSQKDQCQAQFAAKLVGQKNLTEDDIKIMTQSGNVRMVKPNQPVTMDYRSDRVTVITDENNKVIQATCG